MKIFNLIGAGLAMLFVSSDMTANADDVMVRHMTKEGKTEALVVGYTRLPELQKAIRESKPLDRFKTPTEAKTASLIKSPMRDPAGPQDSEEPEGFAVRFAVEENDAPEGLMYKPWKVYVCKGNGEYGREYYNYSYYPNEHMIEQGYGWGCYVPEGEYTIILSSMIYSVDENNELLDFIAYLFLVEENVKIDGDTTITFRQSDAKNRITASCILPNGTEAPDPFMYDENGDFIGISENISSGLSRSIVNINGDYCLNFQNYGGSTDLVYINDLSVNWVYAANMSVVDENGAYTNCVVHPGPITTNLHIQNDPMGYELTNVKFNSQLPGVNTNVSGFGVRSNIAWKGADWSMSTEEIVYNHLGITDFLPLYINASPSDLTSSTAFDLLTVPIVTTDKIKIMTEDWDGTPILDENGEQLYYYECPRLYGPAIYGIKDDTYMCVDSYGYNIDEYHEESFLLPYDEIFSFDKTTQTEFFSEAPIPSIYVNSYLNEEYSNFNFWPSFYYPCLSYYSLSYSFTAKYNGTLFAENETVDTFNFEEWSLENYKERGVFDIELSAAWKTEDPKAIVGNTIHIDTRNEDYFVPQVVRWQLRNQDGSIGDIASADSKIYLMCQEDVDTDFDLSASSPEAEDYNFDVKMIRDESFYEYGEWLIRRVYEISLEDFPGEVGKKYSLEFNLSDASGNTSKQTIGNAFEWATTTGINSVTTNNDIYVANGILHAPANAGIFTIDGRLADRNALTSGLYIVRTGNKTTKVMVP